MRTTWQAMRKRSGAPKAKSMRVMPGSVGGRSSLVQQELHQQRHGTARGALVLAALPGRTGDVQVGPAVRLGEARQEAGGRDGAGRGAADVGQVGEVGLELVLVNKFSYGLRLPVIDKKVVEIGKPQRGDVFVFRYPVDPDVDYIKRCLLYTSRCV